LLLLSLVLYFNMREYDLGTLDDLGRIFREGNMNLDVLECREQFVPCEGK